MEILHDTLSTASGDIGITISKREMDLLVSYYTELMFWNGKMSLVSVKSPLDIPKHVIDSLTVSKYIQTGDATLLDMGTGAGFPGIPLKIRMESLDVTLLDSSRKKTSFLKNVIRRLGLRNISVIHDRAESLIHDKRYQGFFDIVISRAAFDLSRFLLMGEPFLSAEGTLIAMKGDHAHDELKGASDTILRTGLAMTDTCQIKLPITGELRNIFCFQRIS